MFNLSLFYFQKLLLHLNPSYSRVDSLFLRDPIHREESKERRIAMDLSKMIKWLGWNELPPEFLSSLCVCLIIIVLSIVLYFKIKAYDPLKSLRDLFMHGKY